MSAGWRDAAVNSPERDVDEFADELRRDARSARPGRHIDLAGAKRGTTPSASRARRGVELDDLRKPHPDLGRIAWRPVSDSRCGSPSAGSDTAASPLPASVAARGMRDARAAARPPSA
jgi:hypothetical protein